MSIPSLSSYLAQYPSDANWNEWVTDREVQREDAVARQRPVIERFLQGKLPVVDFKKWIDRESKQHNLWGFAGMTGQMFFNMICNNSPDPETLGPELRLAATTPRDQVEAVGKIKRFVGFIRKENERVSVPRKRASMGSVPFFLSYFWNIQDSHWHPIYYPSAVETLNNLNLVNLYDIDEPDQRYDSYYAWMEKVRSDFCSAVNRSVSFTESENFLYWISKQNEEQLEEIESEPPAVVDGSTEEEPGTEHTEIQWMIAKIGKLLGYKVHVARNDAGKTWKGERLGDIGGDELPLPGYYDQDRKVIELIDVIWFRGNSITHLFEVESSTNIYSGLLRMSDLFTLQPSLRPALAIVAPKDREAEAKRIMQPIFDSWANYVE